MATVYEEVSTLLVSIAQSLILVKISNRNANRFAGSMENRVVNARVELQSLNKEERKERTLELCKVFEQSLESGFK